MRAVAAGARLPAAMSPALANLHAEVWEHHGHSSGGVPSEVMASTSTKTVSAATVAQTDGLGDLGSAVRARRNALGLTLQSVADRTGLSVPFLSQIETSFAMPSLTSLFAIAKELDTTPEFLLAGPAPAEVVLTRADEGPRYAVTDAVRSAERRQITGLGEPFSVSQYVVEPGTGLGGFFASRGREMLYVMAGRLIIDIVDSNGNDSSHELAAGDSLVYPTSVQHRWRHTGRGTTHFMLIVDAAE